jgi:hypothetical protein
LVVVGLAVQAHRLPWQTQGAQTEQPEPLPLLARCLPRVAPVAAVVLALVVLVGRRLVETQRRAAAVAVATQPPFVTHLTQYMTWWRLLVGAEGPHPLANAE